MVSLVKNRFNPVMSNGIKHLLCNVGFYRYFSYGCADGVRVSVLRRHIEESGQVPDVYFCTDILGEICNFISPTLHPRYE